MAGATAWKETIATGEAERFERLAEDLHALQRRAARGDAARALHAKGQAGLDASLTVLPDLPEALRVGIFASPATWRAYVRFSNGSPWRRDDRAADVRGLAVKLLGVPGKKLIPGMESATTQDFLLIRTPATPFRSAEEFVGFVKIANGHPALVLPRAIGFIGFRRTLRLVAGLSKSMGAPVPSLATGRYYSAVPVRWGAAAAKIALEPLAPRADGPTPADLGAELDARLRTGPVSWEFRVQLFVDEVRTPIEDASVEWKSADAPFVTVARLALPRQDMASERGQRLAAFVEKLSFDPWHAPEEFRPLGNMMRARSAAYRVSTQERHAAPEPDGTETFEG